MIRGLLGLAAGSVAAGVVVESVLRRRDRGDVPPVRTFEVVDAPIDAVWDVLADLEGQPRWMHDLKAVRITTPGPVGVGTRGVGRVRILGVAVEDPVEISAFEPPTHFAIRHEGWFTGRGDITLESGADGTTTIVRWEERLRPPLLPHLGARLQWLLLVNVFQADLARLRRLVEGEPAAASAPASPTSAPAPG